MAASEFYKQPADAIAAKAKRLQECETQLAAAFARWEELEAAGIEPAL